MEKDYKKECRMLKGEFICNLQMLRKENMNEARKILLELINEGLFLTDLLHKDSDKITSFTDYEKEKVQITKK